MNPAPQRPPGCLVTGTDTGVGKTLCSLGLIHGLRRRGLRVAGMKPLAAGAEYAGAEHTGSEHGWRNEDAIALQAAGSRQHPYQAINPICLPAATAPEIAARLAGVSPQPEAIDAAWQSMCADNDFVVMEGVGGWMAPLAAGWMQCDLARRYRLPVVLVVGLRLGCISHALLSARAIRADGVPLIGWLLSAVGPALAYAEEYSDLLLRHLDAPQLGVLEHGSPPEQASGSWAVERLLEPVPDSAFG